MDGQRAQLAAHRFDRATAIPPAAPTRPELPAPPASRRRPRPVPALPSSRRAAPGLLSVGWAAALGIGWPLAIVASIALEPTPADPNAPVPALIELASLGLFLALMGTAIAAGVRHRAAAVTGVVTGLLAVTFSITCPVSGHHAFGLWWFAQLAVVGSMLAVSAVALLHTRR
jgi:hypothetical protein